MNSISQAYNVTYELHTLGWKAFQDLCSTIAGEIWGQTIQSFLSSQDGGRDGAFRGIWKPKDGEITTGSFTVQCKFTSKRDRIIRLTDLAEEISKAEKLASLGLATNYVLMTNMHLTAVTEAEMKEAFQKVPGIQHFLAYGCESISRYIRESPRLRMLIPRIYGLGDLSQILDERIYAQTKEILSVLDEDLKKFVRTEAFQKSEKALSEHGFLLLLGEAGSGKSTIAAALTLGALDVWKCFPIKVNDAKNFIYHQNPNDPRQLFWIDDVFGSTKLEMESTLLWNKTWYNLQAAIRNGAKVIFTSRDYIYQQAKVHLKENAFPLMLESQVVIQVEKLAHQEKEQLLYNHIRLGTQPIEFKRKIKPFLPNIVKSKYFLPEVIRWLGNPLLTRNLQLTEPSLADFVQKPITYLKDVIKNLDDENRAALAIVFMRGGKLASPIELTSNEDSVISLFGGNKASIIKALPLLEGSFVISIIEKENYYWRYKHPTIRDAFGSFIADNRELLNIYIMGSPLKTLLQEVTCGEVGLTGTKIIVPEIYFDVIIQRLNEIDKTNRDGYKQLINFLAYRCNKIFLGSYLKKKSGLY